MTAAFLVGLLAGWLTFATVLGLAIGALVRFADRRQQSTAAPKPEPQPTYVPREWTA